MPWVFDTRYRTDNLITAINSGELDGRIDAKDSFESRLLDHAVSNNQPDLVAALLAKKSDPNLGCPLHLAASKADRAACVKLLLQYGADPKQPNKQGNTPLYYGIQYLPIAILLIAAGADTHARNKDGKSPMDYAPEDFRSMLEAVAQKYREQPTDTSAATNAAPSINDITLSHAFDLMRQSLKTGEHKQALEAALDALEPKDPISTSNTPTPMAP